LDSSLPGIYGDPQQLRQVILNLIRNACDAIEPVEVSRRTIGVVTRALNTSTIAVEITDRGNGFQSGHRLFEPFYTTKERGMGMGLAICRSILEAHDGRLWAVPSSGVGTTFVVCLPVQIDCSTDT
jgi:signal transduction histidine kinase